MTTFLMITLRQVKISLTLLCSEFRFLMVFLASWMSRPLRVSIFFKNASQEGRYSAFILQPEVSYPSYIVMPFFAHEGTMRYQQRRSPLFVFGLIGIHSDFERLPKITKICSFLKQMIFIKDLLNFYNIFTMNKTVSLLTLILVLTTAAEIQAPALRTSATLRTVGNVKVRTNSNSGCPIPHHELDLVQCDYKQVCVGVQCFGRLCCYGRNIIPSGSNSQMVVFVTFPGPIYQVTQLLNTKSEVRMTENDFQVHFICPQGEICVFESDHQIETRDLNMKKE